MTGGGSSLLIHRLPSFQLKPQRQPRSKTSTKPLSTAVVYAAGAGGSQTPPTNGEQQQRRRRQQMNLSVLRFTFGIPGLDESYLPRWIGYGFGSLLVLNHFAGSTTPAQLRSEALGVSLAAFSAALPYFGRFLQGTDRVDQATLPEGAEQIFLMPKNFSDTQKEDLAWATYVLLRNTNTVSVLISFQGDLCIRGYWKTPDKIPKSQVLDWFKKQLEDIGLSDLKDTFYFPKATESGLWAVLPKGTRSLLVEPMLQATDESSNEMKMGGFVLLASSIDYAYNDKDRAWVKAVANKFKGSRGFLT